MDYEKEIISFAANIALLFVLRELLLGFLPHFCQCNSVCTGIDKISKPYSEIKEASSEISVIISKKNADNNNTTQEEATDVMKKYHA